MALIKQTRPAVFSIRWHRDENDEIKTVVETIRMIEIIDTETNGITPINSVSAEITPEEIGDVVGEVIPTISADISAKEGIITGLQASIGALEILVSGHNAIVVGKDAEIAALQAQIVELTAEPELSPEITVVSKMQALLALENTPSAVEGQSMLQLIESVISQSPRSIQIYWENASHFHKYHPITQQLATAIGLSAEMITTLFEAANGIV